MDNNKPKPKPKPVAPKKIEQPLIEIHDAIVSEDLAEVVIPEVVEAVVVEEVIPAVVQMREAPKPVVPATVYAVVSGEDTDKVFLSKCVYKNLARKRSLTVHHLQRRLNEWGFTDAYLDKDGFYGDLTLKSVADFQSSKGMVSTGMMNADTLTAIFEGDTNVTVILD